MECSLGFVARGAIEVLLTALLCLVVFSHADTALAQEASETEATTPPESVIPLEGEPPIITEPRAAPPETLELDLPELGLSDLRRAQLDVESSRFWLLVTSGTFALGWVMSFAAVSRCDVINDVLICPRAADKATTAGALFLAAGSIGVLVTSIMLGVRNGKKRELERRTLQHLGAPYREAFREYQLQDARDRSRRARNGLIGSAASFGVGWIFLGFAIPRCGHTNTDEWCTSPGYAHATIGLGFASAGTAGMIISGILLGARNARKRELERSRPWRQQARLRWDPRLGAFVF